MRINLISDVHYQRDGLAQAAAGADVFICLGDLVLFLDYDDPSQGIFADLFGEQNARRYISLRLALRFDEARTFSRQLWEALGADTWTLVSEKVAEQYEQLFALMPDGYFTYGNVDVPALWDNYTRIGQQVVDGSVVDINGFRFGFVGGGLRTPMRTPYEISDEDYLAKVAELGPVDVLCTHIPPAVPETCYDVVARRMERGSQALLDYIWEYQPQYALHGHIHQPLASRVTLGRTQVINVGHYRNRVRPFNLDIGT